MTAAAKLDLGSFSLARDLVFLDLETTGPDPSVDRIVQLALIRLRPDGTTEEFESLVNPGVPIPLEAQRVHGITDAMVEFSPSFKHLAPDLLERLRDADLSGFNILRFDLPLLRNELERSGCAWSTEGIRFVDTQVIFHKMEPRDLSAASRFYCGRELEGAHGALADTRASLAVLLAQVGRYPDLPRDVPGLDQMFNQPDRRFVDSTRRFLWRNGEAAFNFGNRRGQTLREVAQRNPDYLQWMLDKDFPSDVKTLVRAAMEGKFPVPPAVPPEAEGSS
jgi:DNA polymerase III subunit epsilon